MWHSGALQAPVLASLGSVPRLNFRSALGWGSFPSTAEQRNQPEQPKAIQSPELLMATEATL